MNFKEIMKWIEEERDVIHCNECKYYEPLEKERGFCWHDKFHTKPHIYCMDAERRKDAEAH